MGGHIIQHNYLAIQSPIDLFPWSYIVSVTVKLGKTILRKSIICSFCIHIDDLLYFKASWLGTKAQKICEINLKVSSNNGSNQSDQ